MGPRARGISSANETSVNPLRVTVVLTSANILISKSAEEPVGRHSQFAPQNLMTCAAPDLSLPPSQSYLCCTLTPLLASCPPKESKMQPEPGVSYVRSPSGLVYGPSPLSTRTHTHTYQDFVSSNESFLIKSGL